ncbi:hypothetical protein B1R94_14375 [Mycolicibacterium litorale]|nr:hypothetical protein B1R94_14375 [Mycolicibacterium litorale]
MLRVAIDAGGTFTDVATLDASGRLSAHKELSHPEDPAKGMLGALDSSVRMADVEAIVNGTTAGLNAVLSRTGTRVLGITTRGFEDVLRIGRSARTDIWKLKYSPPAHLLGPRDIRSVRERILYNGDVERPLVHEDLEDISVFIERERIESVAVCLLHSTSNPAHELVIGDHLARRHPGLQISLSHLVAPQVGEFDRFSSTVVNAYVATIVGDYLGRVTEGLRKRGFQRPLLVMRSSGGVASAATARERPMQTLLSGPAGGVVGAQTIARALGIDHLLAIDMGGTSLDATVIVDHQLKLSTELAVDELPILMPVVDLVTIPAGGGSIAWVDNGNLHTGPQSAGADPGPACYGRGGSEPTVTDANVILNRLGHGGLAGDALTLDRAAACAAMTPLAAELGLTLQEAAQSVVDITDARMADALRSITVRRGYDPRDFALLAFGGAGPLHAVALGEELGVTQVIIPPAPGVFSAWGMLHAPVRHDVSHALSGELTSDALQQIHADLRKRCRELAAADGLDPDRATYLAAADLRYTGQQFSVTVLLPIGSPIEDWEERFRDDYAATHGVVAGHPPVEFVTVRMAAVGHEPL